MDKNSTDKFLLIASRLADGLTLTESGLKHLQHVFTSWFPRSAYFDLTEDTVRVNVVVRRGIVSGKNVFGASFLRADGSVIKKIDYDEDRMLGKVCVYYDQSRSKYEGKKDGFDCRLACYTGQPNASANRPAGSAP